MNLSRLKPADRVKWLNGRTQTIVRVVTSTSRDPNAPDREYVGEIQGTAYPALGTVAPQLVLRLMRVGKSTDAWPYLEIDGCRFVTISTAQIVNVLNVFASDVAEADAREARWRSQGVGA